MARVYLSRRLPAGVRAELESSFELSAHDSQRPPDREQFLEAAAGMDGLLTMLSDAIDDELLDAAGPTLRVVANHAVGFDNVDIDALTRRGVIVSNTPGVLTRATAELTMALILDGLRRVAEGDRFLRRREPWIWSPTFMLGAGLAGRTLGIVGLGRIGREVARLARAFGMHVVYTSRSGPVGDPGGGGVAGVVDDPGRDPVRRRAAGMESGGVAETTDLEPEWLPLDELLRTADVVSLHCPLTPETRHLIDADALAAMRPDSFLVNTTRGPVVDEAALVAALTSGQIGGAALDVFEREPEVGEALLELENVVLCPHLGSGTRETREAMGMLCVEALRAVLLEGRCPANALNPQAWRATV